MCHATQCYSPVRHLLARLLELIIWDDVRQMSQMNQLLQIWTGILVQESGHFVPPCRDHAPGPALPLHGSAICINTRQHLLEQVLTEDQSVPAAGLQHNSKQFEDTWCIQYCVIRSNRVLLFLKEMVYSSFS